MNGELQPWYIDAFDPIAGFCFASNRSADIDSDPDLDLPGLYLAPPMFQPEAMASRGISFAAARGSFQLGLFLDDAEVAFQTLDSLIEFVRRCYLSGGRTDGSGGRGPLPIPPRPDEGRGDHDFPDIGEYGESGSHASVMNAVNQFSGMVREAESDPVAVSYHDISSRTSQPRSKRFDNDLAMAHVGAQLVVELLDRIPSFRIGAPWAVWVDAAARLGHAIRRLHLWHSIVMHHGSQLERALLRAERISADGSRGQFERSAGIHRDFLLLYFGFVVQYAYWPDAPLAYLNCESNSPTDPIDDLSCWPLPPSLARPNVMSVLDHLSAFTGSPDKFAKPLALATAMALFAAAHILRRPFAAWPLEPSDDITPLVRGDHFAQSAGWLIKQFPQFAYPPKIEELIASVATETKEEPPNGRAYAQ